MHKNRLVSLALAAAVGLGSVLVIWTAAHDYCPELPRLTILATLAAFLIALCFRQLGSAATRAERSVLFFCLALAALTLFADARIVIHYRAGCHAVDTGIPSSGKQIQ
jgi:hypothetical protein